MSTFIREHAVQNKLLVATPQKFASWFNVSVKESCEVVKIDREGKTVVVKDIAAGGTEHTVPYDALVLSPGSAAIKPPVPGIDLPGIFLMKTIPDM